MWAAVVAALLAVFFFVIKSESGPGPSFVLLSVGLVTATMSLCGSMLGASALYERRVDRALGFLGLLLNTCILTCIMFVCGWLFL